MALKAGYNGIKKSVLDKLLSLAGAKVIMTIGNGLSLSDVGSLAASIDPDTMEFKDGKLASKSVSSLKTYEYTGNGQNTLTLPLDNPSVIIGIYELGYHDSYKGIILPFDITQTSVLVTWYKTGSTPGVASHSVSVSGSDVTLTGDPTQIANANGAKYLVLYK